MLYVFYTAGTADYSQNPCSVGYYCNAGVINPESCPAGTYRNLTGGTQVDDCYKCPAGYYCPYNGSAIIIPCTNGTYCPNGTIKPQFCEAGFYCPGAQTKIPCPSGFYCPYATANRIPCPTGHYCPGNDNCTLSDAGSITPIICPSGKKILLFVNKLFILPSVCYPT